MLHRLREGERLRVARVGASSWPLGPVGRLVVGFALAIGAPILAREIAGLPTFEEAAVRNAVFATFLAILLGQFLQQRLSVFPGRASLAYVFSAFAAAHLIVAAAFTLFHLGVSRSLLVSGGVLAASWFAAAHVLAARLHPTRLALVPVGRTSALSMTRIVATRTLESVDASLDGVDGVVADLAADHPPEWERFIAECTLRRVPVFNLRQVLEATSGRVAIDHFSENTLGQLSPDPTYLEVKHVLDAAAAAVLLVALSPLLLVVAVAIRLTSPGPAIFRQPRIGYLGREFVMYKFRTMRADAAEADERERAMTRAGDPRVTRIGAFLRATRIDELPQMVNILRGEMSWIGPRPEATVLSRWYDRELSHYAYRHVVRPGISGWAQVHQGHVTGVHDVLDKLHYDFFYIKNISFWLDVVIALKTIRTVMTGHGAK